MESLIAGYQSKTVTVGAASTPQSVILQVPGVGAPLSKTGSMRNALAPVLTVWAGLRTYQDFNPMGLAGTTLVQIEVGILPYTVQEVALRGPIRPAWTLLGHEGVRTSTGIPIPNVLVQHENIPWPVGALLVRVTWEWSVAQDLGGDVDAFVAFAAMAQPIWRPEV